MTSENTARASSEGTTKVEKKERKQRQQQQRQTEKHTAIVQMTRIKVGHFPCVFPANQWSTSIRVTVEP